MGQSARLREHVIALDELHGEQFPGVKYDRNEESLTANEACRISGLSPQQYNIHRGANQDVPKWWTGCRGLLASLGAHALEDRLVGACNYH
jgi:hypothetical protein